MIFHAINIICMKVGEETGNYFFLQTFFSLSCIYWISFSDFLCIDITVYNLFVYESVDLDLTNCRTNTA